jgi:hypothetical protein
MGNIISAIAGALNAVVTAIASVIKAIFSVRLFPSLHDSRLTCVLGYRRSLDSHRELHHMWCLRRASLKRSNKSLAGNEVQMVSPTSPPCLASISSYRHQIAAITHHPLVSRTFKSLNTVRAYTHHD